MLITVSAQNEETKNHMAMVIDISKISYISSLSLEKSPDKTPIAHFNMIIDGVEKSFSNTDRKLMETFYKNLGDSLITYDPAIKDVQYFDVELISKTEQ